MGIIVKFFAAPDDQAAMGVLDAGPRGVFDALEVGNFVAINAVEDWDRILTGRSADQLDRDGGPRLLSDEEPYLMAFSASFQGALIDTDGDRLSRVARQWIEEEGRGYDPEVFTDILSELATMARAADRRGDTLYCWMC